MGRLTGRRTTAGLLAGGVALALLALAAPPGCASRGKKGRSLEGVPVVRVRLLESQPRVSLTASSGATLSVGGASQGVPAGTTLSVERSGEGGWLFRGSDGKSFTATLGDVTLAPSDDQFLKINGQPYRGRVRLVAAGTGKIDVVNDVDIDSYLKGVVPKEMLWNWHGEAYRAQAIVARTYALYEWRMAAQSPGADGLGKSFDLHPDVRSQVYGGVAAETSGASAAVDDTSGIVVAYGEPGQERIFKAYFSSCCGGVRQSSADGFAEPHPAMTGFSVGNLCNASPRFNWGPVVVKKEELTRRFRTWGARRDRPEGIMADVERIDVQASNAAGRPVRFVVTDKKGNRYSLNGEEIRWAVNTAAAPGTGLNSSFFKPVNEEQQIQFVEGHGWGHGVGLCQWCAQAQAEQNTPHEDIVLSAYPGAKLLRAY
jgi:stage II sporulation protein D